MLAPRFACLAAAGLTLVCLSACEADPLHRQNRAVRNPYSSNSAEAEITGRDSVGVPLITIEGPRDRNDTAHVRTIGDTIRGTPAETPAPATAPATAPAIDEVPHGTIDLTPRGTPPK